MRDFMFVANKDVLDKQKESKYLFVIEKIEAEGAAESSVEDKIGMMQKFFEREIKAVKTSVG